MPNKWPALKKKSATLGHRIQPFRQKECKKKSKFTFGHVWFWSVCTKKTYCLTVWIINPKQNFNRIYGCYCGTKYIYMSWVSKQSCLGLKGFVVVVVESQNSTLVNKIDKHGIYQCNKEQK